MRYLLDTDWIIQTFGKHERASRTLYNLASSQMHVSIISVGKVYDGAFAFSKPQAHLAGFRQLLNHYRVLELPHPIMERFAEIRAFLRRQGQLIPDFDLLIAATALYHDLTLLTFNLRHSQRIPQLRLYQPG